jgi:hypothetical protein
MANKLLLLLIIIIIVILAGSHGQIEEDVQYEFSKISSDLTTKYSILASKILRPSTIYQVVASIASESSASCRVMASISRDGVVVSDNEVWLQPDHSQGILLKVPSDNSGKTAKYKLRVEGHRSHGGGLIFEHEAPLEFSR